MEQKVQFEYVGFWLRVVATIIDSIIFFIMINIPAFFMFNIDLNAQQNAFDSFMLIIIPMIFTLAFWVLFKATIGKMIIGAVIVDKDTGKKASAMQYFGRYIGYYVSILLLFIGFFWIGIYKKKQGFHDKIASTVVVKKKSLKV